MVSNRKAWNTKPMVIFPWGPIQEKQRSNKDIGKRLQQAAESDGLVLVEARNTHVKRKKLDYRNWLQFSRKTLLEPGGGKMSAIWRDCRKENWKSCRSGVGKWESKEAIWQGSFGWGRIPQQCFYSRCNSQSSQLVMSVIYNFISKS